MTTWQIAQGTAGLWTVVIVDSDGKPIAYNGDEPLAGSVWLGGEQPPLVTLAPQWGTEPFNGVTTVAISEADTAGLAPATYSVQLTVTDYESTKAYYRGMLEILPAPGVTPPRVAKVTVQNLKKFYKGIEKLLCKGDDPSALEARADAWDWFCDLLQRHYRCGSGLSTDFHFVPGISFAGIYPFGYFRDGRRSKDLADWLAADRLDLTTPVIDAMACYAIGQICAGQVTVDDDKSWADFAAKFEMKAESIASSITAELDTDGDGVNDTTIRLGISDTLEG